MLSQLLRRTLGAALASLPPPQALALARKLGSALANNNWPTLARAERNLKFAFGSSLPPRQRAALARQCLAEAAASWAEILLLPRHWNATTWPRLLRVRQPDLWQKLAASPRGALLATAYLGNPLVAALAAAELLGSACLLTWPLADPSLRMVQTRLARRRLHPLSPRDALIALPRLLASRRAVVLVAEHERPAGPAVPLTFLGRPHRCYPTLGLLADAYDVPIVVFAALRDRGPFQFVVEIEEVLHPRDLPPRDRPAELTRRYMAALERAIRRHPHQYLWIRPWLSPAPLTATRPSAPAAHPAASASTSPPAYKKTAPAPRPQPSTPR